MIKTWRQRCEEHPDHNGIVSEGMIQARMQEEIDELRAQRQWKSLTDDEITKAGHLNVEGERMLPYSFARAIEAKLREKNT